MTRVWQEGSWKPVDEICVTNGERGLLHGYGLFETMLGEAGKLPFLAQHRARLEAALKSWGWKTEIPDLVGAEEDWQNGKFRVRLTVTAGAGNLAAAGGAGLWILSTQALAPHEPPHLGISPWRRNEFSPLAGFKTTSYAENLLVLQKSEERQWDDCFWANTSGALCETCTANVFLVKDDKAVTPSLQSGCLPGIARAWVIETAGKLGIPLEERRMEMEELSSADEIFLTNAVRGPFPVAGKSGPRVEMFQREWRAEIDARMRDS